MVMRGLREQGGGPIIRSPFARAGSLAGDQRRQEFIGNVLAVVGDSPLLWVPSSSDTTTSTTVDRNARTVTWDATIAGRLSPLGSGLAVSFNGSSNYGSVPDADGLSFVGDVAFSIFAWVNVTNTAATKYILTKDDSTTGLTNREWNFQFDSSEFLVGGIWDDSAAANIGRYYNVALTAGSWLFVAMTYDASAANSGIKLYNAGAQIDNTNTSSGVYVGTENKAANVLIGAFTTTDGSTSGYFSGSMACVGLAPASALTVAQINALRYYGNAFFGLSI